MEFSDEERDIVGSRWRKRNRDGEKKKKGGRRNKGLFSPIRPKGEDLVFANVSDEVHPTPSPSPVHADYMMKMQTNLEAGMRSIAASRRKWVQVTNEYFPVSAPVHSKDEFRERVDAAIALLPREEKRVNRIFVTEVRATAVEKMLNNLKVLSGQDIPKDQPNQ